MLQSQLVAETHWSLEHSQNTGFICKKHARHSWSQLKTPKDESEKCHFILASSFFQFISWISFLTWAKKEFEVSNISTSTLSGKEKMLFGPYGFFWAAVPGEATGKKTNIATLCGIGDWHARYCQRWGPVASSWWPLYSTWATLDNSAVESGPHCDDRDLSVGAARSPYSWAHVTAIMLKTPPMAVERGWRRTMNNRLPPVKVSICICGHQGRHKLLLSETEGGQD